MFNARKRKAEPKEKPAWQRALDDDDDVPPPPRAAEPPAVEVPAAVPSSSELLDEDEDDDDDDKDLSAYAFGEEEEEEEDKAARALARNSVQPSCRVRVTNLSHDTRDDQLLELFTGTRPPRTVEMLPPSAASITFETREEAVAAVSLTGIELAGSKLTARPRAPRREARAASSPTAFSRLWRREQVLMEHEPAPQALAAGEGYGGPRAAGYQEQLATYGYKLGGRGSRTGTPKVFFCDDDARSREKQQRREGKRNAVGGKGRGRPQIGQAGASVGPF